MANNEFVNDVNELTIDQSVDQAGYEDYQDAATRRATPPSGRYNLELPKEWKFKKGNAGQLVISVDPLVIVGSGDHDGVQIRFTTVSTKKFKNMNASQAVDLLRNVGSVAQPVTPQEWQETMQDLSGQITENVLCVWQGYDKATKTEYDEKAFPVREDGTRQDYLEITNPETGEVKRVWANLRVAVRGFAIKKEA